METVRVIFHYKIKKYDIMNKECEAYFISFFFIMTSQFVKYIYSLFNKCIYADFICIFTLQHLEF